MSWESLRCRYSWMGCPWPSGPSAPDSSSGVVRKTRMWVRFPVAALVSLSKTLNHNCFVLRMGRKAVGPVCCVIHVKEPSTLIVNRRGLPRCFWLAPRNRQLDWWRFTNVDWIGLDWMVRASARWREQGVCWQLFSRWMGWGSSWGGGMNQMIEHVGGSVNGTHKYASILIGC